MHVHHESKLTIDMLKWHVTNYVSINCAKPL